MIDPMLGNTRSKCSQMPNMQRSIAALVLPWQFRRRAQIACHQQAQRVQRHSPPRPRRRERQPSSSSRTWNVPSCAHVITNGSRRNEPLPHSASPLRLQYSRPYAVAQRSQLTPATLRPTARLTRLEDSRRDVLRQTSDLISSPDDLQQFARSWFQAHGQPMPFVIDPTGKMRTRGEADCALGRRSASLIRRRSS